MTTRTWSRALGLGLAGLLGVCLASAPASAESGKVVVKTSGVTKVALDIMGKKLLTGNSNTGCFTQDPGPVADSTVTVGVHWASQDGWSSTGQNETFKLRTGKQEAFSSMGKKYFVEGAHDKSCGGADTWVLTFTEEDGGSMMP